jgi:hypothetical protein
MRQEDGAGKTRRTKCESARKACGLIRESASRSPNDTHVRMGRRTFWRAITWDYLLLTPKIRPASPQNTANMKAKTMKGASMIPS